MSEPERYAYPLPGASPSRLKDEIAALGLPGFVGICVSGPQIEALFSPALDAEGLELLDAAVAAHDTLSASRVARLRRLDAEYAARAAVGVSAGGVTLDASLEAQNRMDALATMLQLSLTAGVADLQTPFTAYAKDGTPVTLPASQMIGLLLQYAAALAPLSATYASLKRQVAAATTAAELDAVAWPD